MLFRFEHHLFLSLRIRPHAGRTRVWHSGRVSAPHLPSQWMYHLCCFCPRLPRKLRGNGAAQLRCFSLQHRALIQLLPGVHDLAILVVTAVVLRVSSRALLPSVALTAVYVSCCPSRSTLFLATSSPVPICCVCTSLAWFFAMRLSMRLW